MSNQNLGDSASSEVSDLEEPLFKHEVKQKQKSGRILGLDIFRGFIMVLMAWDHMKDNIADLTQHGSETWQGEAADFNDSYVFFFARFVSDICAPGFFFSMGIGMVYFALSRLRKGRSISYLVKHFFERGLVIFLVGRLVNVAFMFQYLIMIFKGEKIKLPFAKPPIEMDWVHNRTAVIQTFTIGEFQVMTALGISMTIAGWLLVWLITRTQERVANLDLEEQRKREVPLYKKYFLHMSILFVLCFALSNFIVVHFEFGNAKVVRKKFPGELANADTFGKTLVRFLFLPGQIWSYSRIAYPLIPWIGLAFLGIGFGFLFKADKDQAMKTIHLGAWSFAILFIFMRLFTGKFGSIRGYPVGDGSVHDTYRVKPLIEFLYTLKYPPSPAYAVETMAINFGLIYWFSSSYFVRLVDSKMNQLGNFDKGVKKFTDFLLCLGNAPLFFYIIHFWFIQVLSLVIQAFYGFGYRVSNFAVLPFLWLPLVLSLYPCCRWFIEFKKRTKEDSWWRLI